VGFLNAVFLFALGAMVLPVVIHILNRRRLRKVRFSSLEFIDELNKRRMSKINLRRWIVLLLRTLAVIFLVLAFARPTLRSGASVFARGAAPKNVIVCLDVSYSMGVEQEQGTAFSLAQDLARRIVDESADHDIVNVVAFDTQADVLFDKGTRNHLAAKSAIDGLEPSAAGTSVPTALATALELARRPEATTSEIYVVSDFRESGDTLVTDRPPQGVRILLVPVYREAVDNVSIDRVFMPRKLIRPAEAVRVGVAVTNHSRDRAAEFPLELLLDGKRKAQKLVSLSPASSANVSFVVSMSERGVYRGRVSKDRDRLPIDDDRHFVLEISQQIPVTLMRGRTRVDGGAGASQAAYYYIDKALNPRGSPEAEFGVEVIDQNSLAVADLPDKGVVVWTDPEALDGRRFDLITRYVDGGGALLVFLGTGPRSAWRDRAFSAYLGIDRASPEEVPAGVRLVSFAGDHPAIGMFDEEELELVSESRLTRYVAVTGVPSDSVLARFDRSKTPAMWEIRRGRGRIIAVAASPDLSVGNLPLSPMFLPLVHASVSYLAQRGGDPRDEHLTGDDLVFDLPRKWSARTAEFRVRTDSGREVRPAISLGDGEQAQVRIPQAREVGFYTLLADTARIAEVGVNLDTRESNLNPLPLNAVAADGVSIIEASGDLGRDIRRETRGREVFAVFLALAVGALVAEAFLGRKA
jgi:hypothetical protein